MTIQYVAWDTLNNAPKTADSANHTLRWIKDGTPEAVAAPAEVDSANCPGIYKVALDAGETACNIGTLAGKSTGNTVIFPVTIQFERLPDAAPAAVGGLPTVDANNRIAGIQGTKTTLDALTDLTVGDVLEELIASHSSVPGSVAEKLSQVALDGTVAKATALSLVNDIVDLIFSNTDELETRLTALRASYLDNLSEGPVAREATAAKELTAAKQATLLDVPSAVDNVLTANHDPGSWAGGGDTSDVVTVTGG